MTVHTELITNLGIYDCVSRSPWRVYFADVILPGAAYTNNVATHFNTEGHAEWQWLQLGMAKKDSSSENYLR